MSDWDWSPEAIAERNAATAAGIIVANVEVEDKGIWLTRRGTVCDEFWIPSSYINAHLRRHAGAPS